MNTVQHKDNCAYIYCPICERELKASNYIEVQNNLHDGYIFVHDAIDHDDSDIDALESGIN